MKRSLLLILVLPLTLTLAQSIPSFTDQDYEKLLRSESRILFYSFSPSMPLSVEGLKEIRAAAAALRATLVPLADPGASTSELLSLGEPEIKYQKSGRLRDLGIQLHYPSVAVSNDHKVVGSPIEGFKTRSAYITLVSDLLKLPWKEEFLVSGEIALPRPMNAFFKPVYGTDLVVSGSTPTANYVLNLETAAAFEGSHGDPGPSPDAEFVTFLTGSGLSWYSIADILSGKPKQLLWDPGLHTYQSVGQLSSSKYRVLGALSSSTNPAGLIVRDFESARVSDGVRTITPLAEWRAVCEGKRISIPMLSKTGELLSGSFEGSLRIFRIGPNATECTEIFDTTMMTGKADFARDDSALVYVARADNSQTGITVDTVFLADLRFNFLKPIHYGDANARLAFPGFIGPDRVIVYEQASRKLLALERTRVFP
jgi:hypothetical protein